MSTRRNYTKEQIEAFCTDVDNGMTATAAAAKHGIANPSSHGLYLKHRGRTVTGKTRPRKDYHKRKTSPTAPKVNAHPCVSEQSSEGASPAPQVSLTPDVPTATYHRENALALQGILASVDGLAPAMVSAVGSLTPAVESAIAPLLAALRDIQSGLDTLAARLPAPAPVPVSDDTIAQTNGHPPDGMPAGFTDYAPNGVPADSNMERTLAAMAAQEAHAAEREAREAEYQEAREWTEKQWEEQEAFGDWD